MHSNNVSPGEPEERIIREEFAWLKKACAEGVASGVDNIETVFGELDAYMEKLVSDANAETSEDLR